MCLLRSVFYWCTLLKGSDVPIEVGVLLVHLAQGLGRAYWGRCFTGAPCSRARTCLLRSVFYWCNLGRMHSLPPPMTHIGTSRRWSQAHGAQVQCLNHRAMAAHYWQLKKLSTKYEFFLRVSLATHHSNLVLIWITQSKSRNFNRIFTTKDKRERQL